MKRYIYIDTKIRGAILQLLSYFENGVFDRSFTVIIKLYKENKNFLKILKMENIDYIAFSSYNQFPKIKKNDIIFYLFNAQSNCRVVSFRDAKHIFITHGESNKLPSVKPILRIYDYVTVAGEAGLDRLLQYKIFNKCESNKIIKMGNTFIGEAHYSFEESSDTLLYAPTWEGGIKEENYSSIESSLKSFKAILKYAQNSGISNVILQFHPNSGHRDRKYLFYIYRGIRLLLKNGLRLKLRKIDSPTFYLISLIYKKMLINKKDNYRVRVAFCDVSAMETQLLDKLIPTYIFFNNSLKALPSEKDILKKYYSQVGVFQFKIKNIQTDLEMLKKIKSYYISYQYEGMRNLSYKDRLDYLSQIITK